MSDAPNDNRQEIPIQDVLVILGQKEVELQYERARAERASQVIKDLRAELATLREGH